MDIELIEIRDFLKLYHPFDLLPQEALDKLPRAIEIRYARRGTHLFKHGDNNQYLWVVRTGAVETIDPEGQLLARVGEGECFGIRALLRGGTAFNSCQAIEDSLLYMLPVDKFNHMCDKYPQFAFFFAPMGAKRLRSAREIKDNNTENMGVLSSKTRDMVQRDVISVSEKMTVHDAAVKMAKEEVSCLLVTKDNILSGIITDKDLRMRVVAQKKDYDTPLVEIMTPNPINIDANDYLFDALLTMSRYNIHHLPVIENNKPIGVITTTSVIKKQAASVVYLVGDIYKRQTVEELKEVVHYLPGIVMNLVETGASAHNIGRMISTISDTLAIRLLQLAEEKFGKAPVPFAWVIMGSEARHEQTALSDQDNGIILDDSYNQVEHGEYFRNIAQFVCDGLNELGYVYCQGNIMATNDKWCQPLTQWKKYFQRWILQPEPKALMHASIFFDMRCLYGEESLYTELREFLLKKVQSDKIFLSFMTGNALTHQPPLGFFKNFVLIKGGEHDKTCDLKHTGVVPIIDLARIYVLDAGNGAVSTQERLKVAAEHKIISPDGAKDLLDALEFISITRLRHQASQIRQHKKVDNFMTPNSMSHFERNHLKDAFNVVKTMQSALSNRYR